MLEAPSSGNCKDLTMKLEVYQIYFPSLIFRREDFAQSRFYNYQSPESLEMTKILAHGIRMQKNSQTRADIF